MPPPFLFFFSLFPPHYSAHLMHSLFFTIPFFHLSRKHFFASQPSSPRFPLSFSFTLHLLTISFSQPFALYFTLIFSYPSFFFRLLTSRYLLSSLQPLDHETHVSEMPRCTKARAISGEGNLSGSSAWFSEALLEVKRMSLLMRTGRNLNNSFTRLDEGSRESVRFPSFSIAGSCCLFPCELVTESEPECIHIDPKLIFNHKF